MNNEEAAEILADLNRNNVVDEAPVNQVEKFKMDYHMDNKNHSITKPWTQLSTIGEKHMRC